MSLSSESELHNRRPARTFYTSTQPPSPRRALSLTPAVLLRVREVMDRRATRSGRTTPSQSASLNDSESRPAISTFPDLVFQLMRRETLGPPQISKEENNNITHTQLEGKKIWEEFNNRAVVLEKDLQKFQDAVKELGSSRELTGAARNMRKSVSLTSRLFEDNAKNLFPQVIATNKGAQFNDAYPQKLPRAWNSPSIANLDVETRPIHVELKAMADSIQYLRLALKQFLEFGDAAEEDSRLLGFEGDLNYWSLCLERQKGQFGSREVQLYIHDLSRELGAQFEDTSHCLRDFIDGVPTVRLRQKHFMASLQNLATIATFFSAVTATTIQYSYTKNDNGIDRAVNVFWFSSLVFSIASALNSFLILTWRGANYSPLMRIPWWLWLWIRQCPHVFLLISVVAFLAGLGCFTISSSQAHFTSIIVIVAEGISAFSLAALLVGLAYDKWSFYRRRHNQLRVISIAKSFQPKEETLLPTHHECSASPGLQQRLVDGSMLDSFLPLFQMQTEDRIPITDEQRKEEISQRAKRRWSLALQQVIFFLRTGRRELGQEISNSRPMEKLEADFRKLVIWHELEPHDPGAIINDIQFNPEGKDLAICRNSLSMRFELNSARMDQFPQRLGHARQVVWTSSAGYLMTRKSQAIHVWRPSGGPVPQPHIIRDNSHYLLAMPDREALNVPKLLSVEGARQNQLAIIDIEGNVHTVQEFKDIQIQHVDVLPDGTRALLAAEIPHIRENKPIRAFPGRKLMVFNLITYDIEHEVPLWHDVQHITISVNGRWVAVAYRNSLPPQLWSLRRTPSGVRLTLERQFSAREPMSINGSDPGQNVRFSGGAHFIGNDRYILCATVDGKIHIWRRDRAHSVHVHSGLTLDKDKPVQIACNRANKEDFMFATRSYDGTIRIWKIQEPPAVQAEKPVASGSNSTKPPGITRLVTSLDVLSESPPASPQDERSSATEFAATDTVRLVTPAPQPSSLIVHPEPAPDIGSMSNRY